MPVVHLSAAIRRCGLCGRIALFLLPGLSLGLIESGGAFAQPMVVMQQEGDHPFAAPIAETEIFTIIPLAVIAVEAFLSIALWTPRLRSVAIVLGATTHLAFVIGAADNPLGFCHLLLINGGLVACYPAFHRLGITSGDRIGTTT